MAASNELGPVNTNMVIYMNTAQMEITETQYRQIEHMFAAQRGNVSLPICEC